MAQDSDERNPSAWLLLYDARALVAAYTKSIIAAEKLLGTALADGRICWTYGRCSGEWQPLDPITIRSPAFWHARPPDHLAIDWDASCATRTGPANTIIAATVDPRHPEGIRTLSVEQFNLLRALVQRGELRATNYTVDLIRLHRSGVLSALQSAGFAVPVAPLRTLPPTVPAQISAKQWLVDVERDHPQRPDEQLRAYAQRLEELMAKHPTVKPKWSWKNIERRLQELRKAAREKRAENAQETRKKPSKL